MLTVSQRDLYQYGTAAYDDDPESEEYLDPKVYEELDKLTKHTTEIQPKLIVLITGCGLSSERLGGDDLVGIVEAVNEAKDKGWKLTTWYTSNADCLIAVYDPKAVTVTESPETEEEE